MLAVAMLALPACHAGVGVGPAVPTAGDFLVIERAETGPITALAVTARSCGRPARLGCGGGTSASDEYEVVGAATRRGPARSPRSESTTRGSAGWQRRRERAWVVAQDESQAREKAEPRTRPRGWPGDVTALAPRRPVKTKGVWAGGPGGLVSL